MKMTPEVIDAAVIQLSSIFEHNPDVPDDVRKVGKEFVTALDAWSERLKNGNTSNATAASNG